MCSSALDLTLIDLGVAHGWLDTWGVCGMDLLSFGLCCPLGLVNDVPDTTTEDDRPW